MTATSALRLFVPPQSVTGGQLVLVGEDAARVAVRGLRRGDTLVALDNSGWEIAVELDHATPESCHGRVVGRALANDRRTKVSLYQGLLHPSDFRRLLAQATASGVVAFVPLITDGSVLPVLDASGQAEGEDEWPGIVRDAAEASGRGRRPTIGAPMLFDHALDEASRAATVLLVDPSGEPPAGVLAQRPFSIDVFCPPPGGFTPNERERAAARRVPIVQAPTASQDPIQPALSVIAAVYRELEAGTADDWSWQEHRGLGAGNFD